MRVGIVGLGKMGRALARHLLAQGVEVVGWNRSEPAVVELEREGLVPARSFAALWDGCDVAASFLADDAAATAVLVGPDGLLAAAPPGARLLEMSTISPRASEAIAAEAAARGVAYLRSPVSGNPEVLAAGNLTLIVSGDRAAYEASRPVLDKVGAKSFYVGDAEQARVVKLAVNAMLAATAEMLAEVVCLGEASGLERSALLEVLAASAIGSPFVSYKGGALLERRYEATFTTAMLLKDLRLVLDLAGDRGTPLPVTGLVAELTAATCDEGLGDLDMLALLPHLQALAGQPSDVAGSGAGSPGSGPDRPREE